MTTSDITRAEAETEETLDLLDWAETHAPDLLPYDMADPEAVQASLDAIRSAHFTAAALARPTVAVADPDPEPF